MLGVLNYGNHQSLCILGGDGTEQKVVENAKYDGCRRDLEGQGKHRDERKPQILAQAADCITEIAGYRVEESSEGEKLMTS